MREFLACCCLGSSPHPTTHCLLLNDHFLPWGATGGVCLPGSGGELFHLRRGPRELIFQPGLFESFLNVLSVLFTQVWTK